MLTRQMNSGENARLSLGCTSIQSRFRAKRFCTATLLSHWHMRTSWYSDSRLSPLGRPLLRWLGEHRRQLRLALTEMKLEIDRLDGSEAHQLSALKKLWQVQGDLAIVELVKHQNSLEALAKRRLEYTLVLSGAQARSSSSSPCARARSSSPSGWPATSSSYASDSRTWRRDSRFESWL